MGRIVLVIDLDLNLLYMAGEDVRGAHLLTCLFRRALNLAVQGLMMVSDGEIYVCFPL